MSGSEKFTLALIKEVKKRPILYDSKYESSGNKNSFDKNTAWFEIATALGNNVKTVKNRWKGLKECYIKCKKSRSDKFFNPINDQYRNWRWASYIEFMEPHLRALRNIENNSNTLEDYEYQEESVNKEDDSEIFDDCPNNESYSIASPKYSSQVNNSQETNTTENVDEIHYLFLSYSETFRKFSSRQQAILKVELAKLFSKAELDSLEEKDPIGP